MEFPENAIPRLKTTIELLSDVSVFGLESLLNKMPEEYERLIANLKEKENAFITQLKHLKERSSLAEKQLEQQKSKLYRLLNSKKKDEDGKKILDEAISASHESQRLFEEFKYNEMQIKATLFGDIENCVKATLPIYDTLIFIRPKSRDTIKYLGNILRAVIAHYYKPASLAEVIEQIRKRPHKYENIDDAFKTVSDIIKLYYIIAVYTINTIPSIERTISNRNNELNTIDKIYGKILNGLKRQEKTLVAYFGSQWIAK